MASSTPSNAPYKFNDTVEYRSKAASSANSSPWRIKGIDTLQPAPSDAPSSFVPAASYQWQGKVSPYTCASMHPLLQADVIPLIRKLEGWLMITWSNWQVLGYGDGWAVTYFAKTLFTPAGLDIYSRAEEGLPSKLLEEIMEKTRALGGELGSLAKGFFEVKRGD